MILLVLVLVQCLVACRVEAPAPAARSLEPAPAAIAPPERSPAAPAAPRPSSLQVLAVMLRGTVHVFPVPEVGACPCPAAGAARIGEPSCSCAAGLEALAARAGRARGGEPLLSVRSDPWGLVELDVPPGPHLYRVDAPGEAPCLQLRDAGELARLPFLDCGDRLPALEVVDERGQPVELTRALAVGDGWVEAGRVEGGRVRWPQDLPAGGAVWLEAPGRHAILERPPSGPVVLPRDVELRVRVEDGGAAVPGCELEAGDEERAVRSTAVTDPRGSAVLVLPGSGSVRRITARAAGRCAGASWKVGQGPLRLQLGPAGGVRGRVLDASGGTPVAGARVRLSPQDGPVVDKVAGADGAFELAGLCPGPATLLAHPPPGSLDHESTSVEVAIERGQVRETGLRLPSLHELAGRVTDGAGRTVFAAHVEAFLPEGGRLSHGWSRFPHAVALTDRAGRFVLRGMPARPGFVLVRHRDHPQLRAELPWPLPPPPEYVLAPGALIEARVRAPDGTPVTRGCLEMGENNGCLRPNEHGVFRGSSPAPGRLTLLLHASGYEPPPALEVEAAKGKLVQVELTTGPPLPR